MERRAVNPWAWQDGFGFAQAIEITAGQRVLCCAGQASVDAQGRPIHAGDMQAQVNQALDNLETVLKASGFALRDVVRLNYYTTDVDGLLGAYQSVLKRLATGACQPASTLCGVSRLAFPELLIEIEATAIK
jgi:enamine deaminase RidA (YjgF/YER057c/UK114 family)